MLRDAAIDVVMWLGRNRGSGFLWKTDFLGNCSHEGQIYFCTTPKGRKSRITLILLGSF